MTTDQPTPTPADDADASGHRYLPHDELPPIADTPDDAEGHRKHIRIEPALDAPVADGDAEGHRRHARVEPALDAPEADGDAEGHRRHFR